MFYKNKPQWLLILIFRKRNAYALPMFKALGSPTPQCIPPEREGISSLSQSTVSLGLQQAGSLSDTSTLRMVFLLTFLLVAFLSSTWCLRERCLCIVSHLPLNKAELSKDISPRCFGGLGYCSLSLGESFTGTTSWSELQAFPFP